MLAINKWGYIRGDKMRGWRSNARECFTCINKWWRSMELSVPTCHRQHRRQIAYIPGREGLHLSLLTPPTREDAHRYRRSNEGREGGLETEKEYKVLWTHGHGAYATTVSGIARWQASVLTINHGLPHCSPVNHRTRGTRELPSVKWNEFISVIPHYVHPSASLSTPFPSLALPLSLFLPLPPSDSPFSAPHLPSLNSSPPCPCPRVRACFLSSARNWLGWIVIYNTWSHPPIPIHSPFERIVRIFHANEFFSVNTWRSFDYLFTHGSYTVFVSLFIST